MMAKMEPERWFYPCWCIKCNDWIYKRFQMVSLQFMMAVLFIDVSSFCFKFPIEMWAGVCVCAYFRCDKYHEHLWIHIVFDYKSFESTTSMQLSFKMCKYYYTHALILFIRPVIWILFSHKIYFANDIVLWTITFNAHCAQSISW